MFVANYGIQVINSHESAHDLLITTSVTKDTPDTHADIAENVAF